MFHSKFHSNPSGRQLLDYYILNYYYMEVFCGLGYGKCFHVFQYDIIVSDFNIAWVESSRGLQGTVVQCLYLSKFW